MYYQCVFYLIYIIYIYSTRTPGRQTENLFQTTFPFDLVLCSLVSGHANKVVSAPAG